MRHSSCTHLTQSLSRLAIALRSEQRAEGRRLGLTATQCQILVRVDAAGARGIRLSEIAAAIAVTPPTASDSAACLTAKGLIRRNRDPADGRACRYRLTAEGKRATAGLREWPDAISLALDTLGPEEKRVLTVAVTKMILALQQRGLIPIEEVCGSCVFFRPFANDGSKEPHYCALVGSDFGSESATRVSNDFDRDRRRNPDADARPGGEKRKRVGASRSSGNRPRE